jgi:glycine/D-amino acid oxidase-like deaminating enzyme
MDAGKNLKDKQLLLNFMMLILKILSKDEIKKNYPMVFTDDLKGGVLMPGDGAADPSGVTAYACKRCKIKWSSNF